jgi:V8-like Glu-specific endopeptidase
LLAVKLWRAALIAVATTASCAQVASAATVSAPAEKAPSQVRAYWTAKRMEAATPLELHLDRHGRLAHAPAEDASLPLLSDDRAADVSSSSANFPERTHGKVFFTLAGGSEPGDYVCSGTVVESNSHSVVWTAGHCVDDSETGGGFATNWIFVPGYQAGAAPYGEWPAKRLDTTSGWRTAANTRVDFGAATVARDADGRGVEDVVGARHIAFGQPRTKSIAAFGYPAEPTLFQPLFDGERLYRCDSAITGSDDPPGNGPETEQIECDMSGGSSGGGWVDADGAVIGLTSYGYAADINHLYGPYFGGDARDLYEQVSGAPVLCADVAVTNLGGGGVQDYKGQGGPQSFRMGGGSDHARGGSGNDAACGGGGNDHLAGSAGGDTLVGGAGSDTLVGGPGRDVCIGGPGRDHATGCEQVRSVP